MKVWLSRRAAAACCSEAIRTWLSIAARRSSHAARPVDGSPSACMLRCHVRKICGVLIKASATPGNFDQSGRVGLNLGYGKGPSAFFCAAAALQTANAFPWNATGTAACEPVEELLPHAAPPTANNTMSSAQQGA